MNPQFTLSFEGGDHAALDGMTSLTADLRGNADFKDSPNLISRPLKTMVRYSDTMLAVPLVATGAVDIVQHVGGAVTAQVC
jgi:hypothetical protein